LTFPPRDTCNFFFPFLDNNDTAYKKRYNDKNRNMKKILLLVHHLLIIIILFSSFLLPIQFTHIHISTCFQIREKRNERKERTESSAVHSGSAAAKKKTNERLLDFLNMCIFSLSIVSFYAADTLINLNGAS